MSFETLFDDPNLMVLLESIFTFDEIEELNLSEKLSADRRYAEYLGYQPNLPKKFLQDFCFKMAVSKYRLYQHIRTKLSTFSWENMFTKDEVRVFSEFSLLFKPNDFQDIVDNIRVDFCLAEDLYMCNQISDQVYYLWIRLFEPRSVDLNPDLNTVD